MPGTVTHHSDLGGHQPVVLTTCQVQIVNAEGSTKKARALLDAASSTLFVMKSLAQHLHLSRWHRRFGNLTFLTRNGGSQLIKSLWKDSGSGGDSAA